MATATGPHTRLNISCFLFQCFIIAYSRGDGVTVEHPDCRLFIAESTIPNAGLGIFTGTDLQEGDAVAEPDIVVPLPDHEWHASEDTDFWFLWNDYSWHPAEVGMNSDMEDGHALVIGTGCMPNCNFALINTIESKPDYDHAGLHRSKDVGISGFTGFHNQRMFTTRTVPAGGELFVSYGEHWFADRTDIVGAVPFHLNFERVDKFLKKFKKMSLKYQKSDNPDFTRDLWDVIKTGSTYDTRNRNALPLSFEDMQSAQAIGSAESRLPQSVRTLEWLNEHGRCMDNIRPGNSTIPQAGRGAFASRKILKGGLVAPGPLLHIANRTALNLYDEGDDGIRDTTKPVGMQLIINYCFGHKQSTVILCPYTSPSAYINHNSESPNAKIVWSKDSTPSHNTDWLEENVEFLKTTDKIGLSLDFVATREIQPGEEVLIDYGPEWEVAWNKYKKGWSPLARSDKYVPASMLQEPFRTATEQLSQPYPDNIVFYCHYEYEIGVSEGPWVWEDEWKELALYPCRIFSREASDAERTAYYYTMVILNENELEYGIIPPLVGIPSGENHILTNVPRWAIEVRDKLYTKDEFLSKSFRHEMMMPNEIFPETWKNL
eukprot:CAMPEP_0172326942 /NCGR_PEP_ID=MMETSP1058-20130122/58069_1 /TAXON_ID=83371 /ORGANISM="Detonula confervacea, Strain CCMP 353" /LENGTH=602 /DNA_ID=CAMNT_0013043851 /DNA_START=67 /DNA_END=1875 /DNA_ORIENTATION=-